MDGGSLVTVGKAAPSDTAHPPGFGCARKGPALFRRGTTLLPARDNPYITLGRYNRKRLLSGFNRPQRLDKMKSQPVVVGERNGEGLVKRLVNSLLFRGFWREAQRPFVKRLYFGQVVKKTHLQY